MALPLTLRTYVPVWLTRLPSLGVTAHTTQHYAQLFRDHLTPSWGTRVSPR